MEGNEMHTNRGTAMRILLIEDDKALCESLLLALKQAGYGADACHTGTDGLLLSSSGIYDCLIIDRMLPEMDGLTLLEALRRQGVSTPAIFSTALDGLHDRVRGLDAGADDFISKPFSTRELVARIRSVLRRRRMMTARRMSNVMRYKTLAVDFSTSIVTIDDKPVSLTRTEYLILAMFLRHRNQFFDRAEIIHEAWEEETSSERAVDTNISRLRKKLGNYGKHITNRQGFGYGFIE